MSPYRIELRPAAVRALRGIAHADRGRIQAAIALLAQDPRPPGARALQGRPGYRVRVGDYRIIYTVQDDVLLVSTTRRRASGSGARGSDFRPKAQPCPSCGSPLAEAAVEGESQSLPARSGREPTR